MIRRTVTPKKSDIGSGSGITAQTTEVPRPRLTLRIFWTKVHRYTGLTLATFLIVAGLTGSVIAFYQELDALLNPTLFKVQPVGKRLTPDEWIAHAESARHGVQVSYLHFPRKATDTAALSVSAAPGQPEPDYNQLFLNPYSGAILGHREWGDLRLDRAHLIPFLYELHYSLHLGETGVLIFGVVSLVWFFDCFVGLYLGWPRRTWQAIKQAFSVKWSASRARINFDLHRASGLWFWGVLAVVAFSGMAMNLHEEVFDPVVKVFSRLSPWPEETIPKRTEPAALFPFPLSDAIASAKKYLASKDLTGEVGAIGINHAKGTYRVRFYSESNIMRDHPEMQLFVSGETGAILGEYIPGEGTAGDILSQWQYPLHSGKAFGLPGRILICLTGVATALLSVTGILIWWRKRRNRAEPQT